MADQSSAAVSDAELRQAPGELVIVEKLASALHGTPLASHRSANRVDTVIGTGAAAGAGVRHTIEDAIADGFRPIAVRAGVGGAVEWNLFDIDAEFGDVEPLDRVLDHLESNEIGRRPRAS